MDARREFSTKSEGYDAPPPRDRLPTLPEDLSEYAWIHTGPSSRTAQWLPTSVRPSALHSASAEEWEEVTAGQLVDIHPSDVPHVISNEVGTNRLDDRELWLVMQIDGRSSVGTLLESCGMSAADFLDALGELCARGVVSLGGRSPTRAIADDGRP